MKNLLLYFLFALFFGFDIYHDLMDGVPISHIWHESALFIFSISAISWQIWIVFKKNKHISLLNSELLATKKSYQEWRDRSHDTALQIRQMIDEEFSLWHLSHSEKDVALLLIKGLSMKEIAEIRNTHEKTVRQQATSIYKKSGMSGRQELSAYFLEDILSMPAKSAE